MPRFIRCGAAPMESAGFTMEKMQQNGILTDTAILVLTSGQGFTATPLMPIHQLFIQQSLHWLCST